MFDVDKFLDGEVYDASGDFVKTLLTPELARRMVEGDSHDARALSNIVVDRYADRISALGWPLTHQAMAVDTEGRLLDGHHRCYGVIKSGVPIWVYIAFNQPSGNFKFIDTVRQRKGQQFVHTVYPGIPYPTVAANAAHFLMAIDGLPEGVSLKYGVKAADPSMDQVLATLADWPELPKVTEAAQRVGQSAKLGKAPHCALLCMALRTPYADLMTEWVTGLTSGANLDGVLLLLRNQFLQNSGALNNNSAIRAGFVTMLTAWNHFTEGTCPKHLRIRLDAPVPRMIGFEY